MRFFAYVLLAATAAAGCAETAAPTIPPGADREGTLLAADFKGLGYVQVLCEENDDGDSALWRIYGQTDLSGSFGANYSEKGGSASVSGAVSIDWKPQSVNDVTLTANVTSLAIINVPSGGVHSVTFRINHGAGGYSWSHPANTNWEGGSAPTLSSGANEIDWVTYVTLDGGSNWDGFLGGTNFS